MPYDAIQIAIGIGGLVSPVLIGAVSLLINRNLKLQDRAATAELSGLRQAVEANQATTLAEIRATRSDVKVVMSHVDEHGRQIAALSERSQSLQDQQRETREDVKKLVREGCAIRAECGAAR